MESYVRTPNVACLICTRPIYRRPSEITRNKGHVFCSVVCYGKFIRKEKPCLVCGKLIMAQFNKKTCSRACANKHREGIRYKMSRPHDREHNDLDNLELLCPNCHYEEHYLEKSWLNGYN